MEAQINVIQDYTEWLALREITATFYSLSIPKAYKIISEKETSDFNTAQLRIRFTPLIYMLGSTSSVLFSKTELNLLVRLIEWYDNLLLAQSERLELGYPDFLTSMYYKVGLVKRNLLRHATDQTQDKSENVETDDYNSFSDSSNTCGS